jgi:hypothetical protein
LSYFLQIRKPPIETDRHRLGSRRVRLRRRDQPGRPQCQLPVHTPENRRAVPESCVQPAAIVGKAIAACARPPARWLQASTATIYAHRLDAPNDDVSGVIGGHEPDVPADWHFSIDVATAWERAATDAVTGATRLVLLRSAMVTSPDAGGILRRCSDSSASVSVDRSVAAANSCRGSTSAISCACSTGSWNTSRSPGAVNIVAPNPLSHREFMRALRPRLAYRSGCRRRRGWPRWTRRVRKPGPGIRRRHAALAPCLQ